MTPPRVITLIGKPDCHLCATARAVIDEVLLDPEISATLEEVSILDDQALFERYWQEIPVVLIDGQVHTIWRVQADRLRGSLLQT